MKIKVFDMKPINAIFEVVSVVAFIVLAVAISFSLTVNSLASGELAPVSASVDAPLVIIDAGHGGEDVGAIGVNGVYEKDLNLQFAFTLGEMLLNEGYDVFYTRTQDKLLYTEEENIKGMRKIYDLKNRAQIVNEKMPSMFISIHMNYFSEEKYSGFEVYYRKSDSQSQRLAYDIADEVKHGVDNSNKRTPKEGEDIYLLKNTTCPAVLLECGFISNAKECEKLCQKEYQKQLCFSIVCGMIKYESRLLS